jgi:malate dehydrogenase (oxaloacetate-decarboxylating)(NADP+)
MKVAAVEAIRSVSKMPVPDEVLKASNVKSLTFGKDYIIPKPMDPRLCKTIATAVAKAAIASGVAHIETLPDDYLSDF